MFCTKCGKEIPDVEGALYCPQCGIAQLSGAAAPAKKTSLPATLAIVVAIGIAVLFIGGILAAIAIPQFVTHRAKAANASAVGNLRSAKAACDAYFSAHQQYPDELAQAGFRQTAQVTVQYDRGADKKDYVIVVYHAKSDRQYATNSEQPTIYYRLKTENDEAYRPL